MRSVQARYRSPSRAHRSRSTARPRIEIVARVHPSIDLADSAGEAKRRPFLRARPRVPVRGEEGSYTAAFRRIRDTTVVRGKEQLIKGA